MLDRCCIRRKESEPKWWAIIIIAQNAHHFHGLLQPIVVGKCFRSKWTSCHINTIANMIFFFPGLFVGLRRVRSTSRHSNHTRFGTNPSPKETVCRQEAVKVVKLTIVGAIVANVEEQAWPSAEQLGDNHWTVSHPLVGLIIKVRGFTVTQGISKGKFIRPTFETSANYLYIF